jgi:two-component system sensor histidine kinase/response regulator
MAQVLFVDDEPENLAVFEAACAGRFSVLTATTGVEALEIMRSTDVAVLLADQRMPVMSGLELLEHARRRFPEVVRMLVTAYSDLQTAVGAINRGQVRRYLKKPWDHDELISTLSEAVEYHEMRSKLSALERRLVETERVYSLGVISAGLARELRAPVSSICASVARARSLLRPVADSLSTDTRAQAALKAQLVDADEELAEAEMASKRVLDVARGVEIPNGPCARETVDASEVLRLSLRLMQNELKVLSSIEIDHRPVPLVAGSTAQLGQVVLNLLLNALDSMSGLPRARRKLVVRLFFDEPWVRLEFADSGPPLSDDFGKQTFDPFGRTRGPRGFGLGLAISKTIVEEVGGRLEADNIREGGVTFKVLLPKA